MDDLISRKEAIEYLDKRRTYELMDGRNKAYGKGVRDAIKDIVALPSVPAVPLDKLCEWLAEYMTAPGIDVYEVPKNLEKNKAAWKVWLAEKMEGQNAD